MSLLNLEALRQANVQREPFEYLVVEGFVRPEAASQITASFPQIDQGGSFPLTALRHALDTPSAFQQLCEELQADPLRQCFADAFQIDLANRPTTLTVRGQCRGKDGKIHTDSKSKLITVLLYLNEDWQLAEGSLRLLRSGHDLEDMITEVRPEMGTLVAFRNGPAAWHGHTSFEGERRAMQLNWVKDASSVRRSERRHGWSSLWKRFMGRAA